MFLKVIHVIHILDDLHQQIKFELDNIAKGRTDRLNS